MLVNELLSRMIEKSTSKRDITGIKISKNAPLISHLFFADDLLIFCKANTNDISSLRAILDHFTAISGQSINYSKSDSFAPLKSAQQLLDLSLECLECQSYHKVFPICDSLFIGGENQLNGSCLYSKRLKEMSKAGMKLNSN